MIKRKLLPTNPILIPLNLMALTLGLISCFSLAFAQPTPIHTLHLVEVCTLIRDVPTQSHFIWGDIKSDLPPTISQIGTALDQVASELGPLDTTQNLMAYIRHHRYGEGAGLVSAVFWSTMAGQSANPSALELSPMGREALDFLINLKTFTDPHTGKEIDFIHLIAVIDSYTSPYENKSQPDTNGELDFSLDFLASFGGDTLTYLAENSYEASEDSAASFETTTFSDGDFLADVDGLLMASQMKSHKGPSLSLGDHFRLYYSSPNHRTTAYQLHFGGHQNFAYFLVNFVIQAASREKETASPNNEGQTALKMLSQQLWIRSHNLEKVESPAFNQILHGPQIEALSLRYWPR